jgi:hypothetical protein
MFGSVRRNVEVKDDTVEVTAALGWAEAPAGKQIVVGGRRATRVAFEEGTRKVQIADEASGAVTPVELRITAGRATPVP